MPKAIPSDTPSDAQATLYYKVLLQYYSVLLAAVTVAAPHALRMKKKPHEKDCECSCIQHNWTIPPNPENTESWKSDGKSQMLDGIKT